MSFKSNQDIFACPLFLLFLPGEVKTSTPDQIIGNKIAEKNLLCGADGKSYEYIEFFYQIDSLGPGDYRYAIFYNDLLLYEDKLIIQLQK